MSSFFVAILSVQYSHRASMKQTRYGFLFYAGSYTQSQTDWVGLRWHPFTTAIYNKFDYILTCGLLLCLPYHRGKHLATNAFFLKTTALAGFDLTTHRRETIPLDHPARAGSECSDQMPHLSVPPILICRWVEPIEI
jgi:hypothetical protein